MTGWGGESGEGGSAGTGVYFGAKNWYAEFGGFTYQQFTEDTGKIPGATFGAGANITFYFTDADKFFLARWITQAILFCSYQWFFLKIHALVN